MWSWEDIGLMIRDVGDNFRGLWLSKINGRLKWSLTYVKFCDLAETDYFDNPFEALQDAEFGLQEDGDE